MDIYISPLLLKILISWPVNNVTWDILIQNVCGKKRQMSVHKRNLLELAINEYFFLRVKSLRFSSKGLSVNFELRKSP